MRIQKRTFISFLLLLIFVILPIVVYFPNPRWVSEVNIPNEILNQTTLKVNFPDQIWFGQSEKINIQLLKGNSQNGLIKEKPDLPDFDSRKIQNLKIDLVLTGAELTPPGISITPIIAEKNILMNWRVEPIADQDVIGTVWIYINTFYDGDEKDNKRELIFTKDLHIKVRSVCGLKIGTTQWILSIFTLLNIIYLLRSFRKMSVCKGFPK